MPSVSPKLNIKMQQVARYRVTGRITDARIAELVGLSASGLAALLKNPDYIEIEAAMLEGRLSQIDEQIANDDDALRGKMKLMVPAALNTMLECVLQRRDLRTALAASKEILDRDPDQRFAAKRPGDSTNGTEAPTLPESIITRLAVDGNKVVAELRVRPQAAPSVSSAVITKELSDPKKDADA